MTANEGQEPMSRTLDESALLGQVLSGRYQLLRLLGKGGMGTVWKARHLQLGTDVAVKLVEPRPDNREDTHARFVREARAAASIQSRNIVRVTDFGKDGDQLYLVMEYLEGETLAARLDRVGTLTPHQTVEVLAGVARALEKAHRAHIVHRDLKPENIFISTTEEDEVAKILDFGVAHIQAAPDTTSITMAGAMVGTPYYMSPEQVRGERAITPRSDVWAFSIIAYECLVGQRPFEADTLGAAFVAICTQPFPRPSSLRAVPIGFDEWFERGTARSEEDRFQTVSEAIAELQAVCLNSDVSEQRPLPPESANYGAVGSITDREHPAAWKRLLPFALFITFVVLAYLLAPR